jgi:hypothetical protein
MKPEKNRRLPSTSKAKPNSNLGRTYVMAQEPFVSLAVNLQSTFSRGKPDSEIESYLFADLSLDAIRAKSEKFRPN